MWRNVALYVLIVVAFVAGLLLLERVVAGGHSSIGHGGRPSLDAEYDFDRVWAQHRRRYWCARLLGRPRRLDMPVLESGLLEWLPRRYLGEQPIPLEQIVGSVNGAAGKFDRSFRPAATTARARMESVLGAMREGTLLPPIEVYRLGSHYYVLDGHHRVAAARALGEDYIVAQVTDLSARGRAAPEQDPAEGGYPTAPAAERSVPAPRSSKLQRPRSRTPGSGR